MRVAEVDVRQKIHDLLVTGDNRLKQGVSPEKIRQSYEQALALALEHGLADHAGRAQPARDVVVRDAADEPDPLPSVQARPQRTIADERQRAAAEARKGVGEAYDVLAVRERADVHERGMLERGSGRHVG